MARPLPGRRLGLNRRQRTVDQVPDGAGDEGGHGAVAVLAELVVPVDGFGLVGLGLEALSTGVPLESPQPSRSASGHHVRVGSGPSFPSQSWSEPSRSS